MRSPKNYQCVFFYDWQNCNERMSAELSALPVHQKTKQDSTKLTANKERFLFQGCYLVIFLCNEYIDLYILFHFFYYGRILYIVYIYRVLHRLRLHIKIFYVPCREHQEGLHIGCKHPSKHMALSPSILPLVCQLQSCALSIVAI